MYSVSCYQLGKVCSMTTANLCVSLWRMRFLPSANLRTSQQLLIFELLEEQLLKGTAWEVPMLSIVIINEQVLYHHSHIPYSQIPQTSYIFHNLQQQIILTGFTSFRISYQQIYRMGQQESRQHSLIDNKNWRLVSEQQSQVFHHINPYCNRALFNSFTGEYVEEYQLQFISEEDYLSYAKELELRKEPAPYELQVEDSPENAYRYSPYIYKVKYFLNTSAVDMCSTIHKGLLYVQKVDLRLKEINDIPFADQLYLLQATLQGFKVLYQRVGYFDISEEMIFISCRGKVRVWMNPNLAKNLPYYVPRVHESTHLHGSQSQMIVNLINIIEENTDIQNSEAIHFKQHLINKGVLDRLSFYKALEEFQLYCLQNHLIVHDYMRSIYDLYQEDPHHLAQSRAEHSEVVRIQTNREFHFADNSASKSKSKSKSNHRNRNYSPDFTAIKKSQLSGSHASKRSYASYKSVGEKASRKHENSRRDYEQTFNPMEYPSIPPLPINHGRNPSHAYSPRPANQISFAGSAHNMFGSNELSLNQLNQQLPLLQSSRRNSIRNNARRAEQSRINPAAIKFNYAPPSISLPEKQNGANNQRTVGTMNSMSSFSKQTEFYFDSRPKEHSGRMTYHSPNYSYNLDSEIVADLQKFLGFDVNQL